MSEIKNQKRETSWYVLTSDNLKGIKIEDTNIKEKEESLDTQDNQNDDDYVWEDI